jgi:dipeptidyl aminopeptidase/acylaminoacyl peptidase
MFNWAWPHLRLLFFASFLFMGFMTRESVVGWSAFSLPLDETQAGSPDFQFVSSRPIGNYGDFAYLGEDGNIWLFEMDNFTAQPLTQEGNYRLLRWSKDGQKIAAVRKGQESQDWIEPEVDELWVISVDRREKHKIVLFSAVPGNFPLGIINLEWVENDRSILFSVSFTRGPAHAFYRVGADEREVIINFGHEYDDCSCRLNEPAFGEADYFSDIDFFRVSGTGRLVGTRIDVDNDFVAHWRIVSGLTDFSQLATLSNDCQGNSRNPSWSPDESTIAYTCDGVSINLLNVATGQDQVIGMVQKP